MCFVVVVIGGIGSVRGALIAALLVGFVDTFGKVLLPQVAGMLVYMLMAAVLLWKPEGPVQAMNRIKMSSPKANLEVLPRSIQFVLGWARSRCWPFPSSAASSTSRWWRA
jgi:hypothetical protein